MKKTFYFYIASLFPALCLAQSLDQNYIKTTVYKDSTSVSLSNPTATQAVQTLTYFDGLGRPVQQVVGKQSATGKDILTHIEYDLFGRQAKEYLPYPSATNTLEFVDPVSLRTATQGHYQTAYGEPNPYSEKKIENSPLNRILQQAAPGSSWALGSGHEIKTDYLTNGLNEVKIYKVTAQWQVTQGLYVPTLTLPMGAQGFYPAGQLYKTVTKDENWVSGFAHTTEEFKDKEGRIVLKRTYATTIVEDETQLARLDTYYAYDQFGNLSYVITPQVSAATQPQLNGWCYQYRYDFRNRLVEKKLPGKQWEFILYDRLDRPVATGPAYAPFSDLAPATGWIITKYDDFNRVCYTAWMAASIVNSEERKKLQDALDMPTKNMSETKLPSGQDTTVNGVAFGYSNDVWPTSGYHVLTVNYYDEYNFPDGPSSFVDFEQRPIFYNLNTAPIGLATGTWIRALESSTASNASLTHLFYDQKGRSIQEFTKNHLGGHTKIFRKLDFSGKVLYSITSHKREGNVAELQVREDFTYSDQDRLLTHTHQINSDPVQLLASNSYDELGQLVGKSVGGMDTSGNYPLQKVSYDYNIRGWLKNINDVNNLVTSGEPDDLFSFRIHYDSVENSTNYDGQPLFNGNISETLWKTSDNVLRKYGYFYDPANRLLNSVYIKNDQRTESYNELIQYDNNGNITFLQRNGGLDDDTGLTVQIDDLYYQYNMGNQLQAVDDFSINPQGFNDGAADYPEYLYDANGNMTKDLNKGITSITYNHLNLPTKIAFGSESNMIAYLYDASGLKLKKTVKEGGTLTEEIDYLTGFQYAKRPAVSIFSAPILEFFPTAEGYVKQHIRKSGDNYFGYVFNYTDHLGNVRVSYEDMDHDGAIYAPNEVLEENNYYPFGLKHQGYNADLTQTVNKYRYQGQEWQDDLQLNIYFFKYRMSDPAIGRFLQIDPLSDGYVYNSPYAFAENKVVANFELEGLEAKIAIYGEGANGTAYTVSDKKSFKARATTLEKNQGYSTAKVSNGAQLLSSLKTATAEEGSIQSAIIYAHGGYKGVFLDNDSGFYVDNYPGNKNSASVSNLVSEINKGKIKFEENASIIFGSCNSCNNSDITSIASSITEKTGVTTVGATGYVYPEIENGKETGNLLTDGTFIKSQKVFDLNTLDPITGQTIGTLTFSSKKLAEEFAKSSNLQTTIKSRIKETDLGNKINPSSL